MLSNEEKKELLKDSKSKKRLRDFSIAKNKQAACKSFDDYFMFLNSVQKVFKPFSIPTKITPTALNKL